MVGESEMKTIARTRVGIRIFLLVVLIWIMDVPSFVSVLVSITRLRPTTDLCIFILNKFVPCISIADWIDKYEVRSTLDLK